MNIRIGLFNPTAVFLGLRFSKTKLVTSLHTYDKDKEYPYLYLVEIGLLFIDITIEKRVD
jgi:hypothetical protein